MSSVGCTGGLCISAVRGSVATYARAVSSRATLVPAVLALSAALLAAFSPGEFLGHFTVFALAVVAGYYVISNVAHALHTPLMAETNAISGIILVGGILQVGTASNALILVLPAVPVLVASINIFGGFLVTLRMLQMFRKG